jgi:hypothetical protein
VELEIAPGMEGIPINAPARQTGQYKYNKTANSATSFLITEFQMTNIKSAILLIQDMSSAEVGLVALYKFYRSSGKINCCLSTYKNVASAFD